MTYSDSAVEGNAAFAPPTRPASQAWAACSPGQSVANPDPLQQLSAAVRRAGPDEQTRRFVERFVRPRGLDAAVTPVLVEEIELAAGIDKRPSRAKPWHYLARLGIRGGWRLTRALPRAYLY